MLNARVEHICFVAQLVLREDLDVIPLPIIVTNVSSQKFSKN